MPTPTISGANDEGVAPRDVEAVLRQTLDSYPEARVAAVRANGLFRDMPASLDLGNVRQLEGRAGMELVAPESRATVLEQFRQLGDKGALVVDVRLVSGKPGRYALFDLTDHHGVVILVVIEGEPDDDLGPAVLTDLAPVKPRYGRVKRTDFAEMLDVDDATLEMLGYNRDDFAALDTQSSVHPDDYGAVVGQWFDLLTAPPGTSRRVRARYRRGDGSWLWIELTVTQHLDDPEQPHMMSEMVDISEEMAAMDEVWQHRELLLKLTEALPIGVLQIDAEKHVVHSNDRLYRIVGAVKAETLDEALAGFVDEDRHAFEEAVDQVLSTGAHVNAEYRFRRNGHALRYAEVAIRALRDRSDAVNGAILCVSDVTDATRMRRELEVRATVDQLTGCYNRAAVMAEIERVLEGNHGGTAVVFVDLDEFKPVNDRLGHAAGDELLKAVANALGQSVRSHDVVGRLGGDEFVVLCCGVGTRELAIQVGERVANTLSFSVPIDGEEVPIRSSIGVAWTDETGASAETLVAEADEAMYQSKRGGGNRVVVAGVSAG